MNGAWLRKPSGFTSVVFVHGILSSGETCWRNENGTTWPTLLLNESSLEAVGIYIYTYSTSFFSGSYRLGDVVDDLKERLTLDGLADAHTLIFVCHSMGGIVVRKLLVERASDFVDRNITCGLFLVASPSLGSQYASWLAPLANLLGHAQGQVLCFSQENQWLNDLDKEFLNLKESGRLRLRGKELVEDKFVTFKKVWKRQVVEPFSGARYFGERLKVAESDHFSIAKPADANAIQHRALCRFIQDTATIDERHHGNDNWDKYGQAKANQESIFVGLPKAGGYNGTLLAMVIAGVLKDFPVRALASSSVADGYTLLDLYFAIEKLIENFQSMTDEILATLESGGVENSIYGSAHRAGHARLRTANRKLADVAADMRELSSSLTHLLTDPSDVKRRLESVLQVCATISVAEDFLVLHLGVPDEIREVEEGEYSQGWEQDIGELADCYVTSSSCEEGKNILADMRRVQDELSSYRRTLRHAIAEATTR